MEAALVIASVTAQNTGDTYSTKLLAGEHSVIADEPVGVGGNNTGPTPGDYLCMALASCKAITLRMYAQRKQWAVGEIHVNVRLVKSEQEPSGLNTFHCTVRFTGALKEDQVKRLLEIAKECPVDRLLQKPSEVITTLE